jgi:acyl-coenzyme A synthetase/AMP-(fatty) acid ligase
MGDMGYLDRSGRLHLVDREIDQIDAVGSNLEIEDTLLSRLEELREVVVVAGASGEPVPVVCTRGDTPLDHDRWKRATADLAELTDPLQWRFEDLPRTSTWKIKRVEIARMLAAGATPAAVAGA